MSDKLPPEGVPMSEIEIDGDRIWRMLQEAIAYPFNDALTAAGYTIDALPHYTPTQCFRCGPGFRGYGAFMGIPVIIEEGWVFYRIVFEDGTDE